MTINCLGQLIDLSSPKVMGILNITPDSFYDGNRYNSDTLILAQVEKMLRDGAAFIDMGAYSSRPKAAEISEAEEQSRLLPIVKLILDHFPDALLSIDTFRSNIAQKSLDMGASMINDISAGALDEKMMEVVSVYKVPYVMMHMRGTPQTMSTMTHYDDIVKEMLFYFSEKVAKARSLGINDVIIDPGFGFAKTLDQNFEVLQKMELFQNLELPILAGISRKSMVYKVLNSSAEEALNGTTALHMIALMKGASILRVHDVKEALECIRLFEKFSNQNH
ncbi:MAG: dihydropteroate synthase [Flavobacterium sp.]|nr:dihydropteroate synthase [Flavobacterium sp.]